MIENDQKRVESVDNFDQVDLIVAIFPPTHRDNAVIGTAGFASFSFEFLEEISQEAFAV